MTIVGWERVRGSWVPALRRFGQDDNWGVAFSWMADKYARLFTPPLTPPRQGEGSLSAYPRLRVF